MSFVDFKEITPDNPGTTIRYGGNDLKEVMQIMNGKTVANRRPRIANRWAFDTFLELKNQAVTPIDPPTDYIHVYPRAIDANNYGWFAKTRENNVIVEVRIL